MLFLFCLANLTNTRARTQQDTHTRKIYQYIEIPNTVFLEIQIEKK